MRSFAFIEDELRLCQEYIGKKYIGDTFSNRQRWKFKLCYTIWTHKFIGLDIKSIRSQVKRYLPLVFFYPIAYVKLVKDKLKEIIKLF
jgi:hypothetical protein